LATGYYLRQALTESRALRDRIVEYTAQTEAQSEVLYLLLRRLRTLEREVESIRPALEEVRAELAAVRNKVQPGASGVSSSLRVAHDEARAARAHRAPEELEVIGAADSPRSDED
jgi:hypothetical protein